MLEEWVEVVVEMIVALEEEEEMPLEVVEKSKEE